MRSAANIKGHPIHPMLIPFPLAFLTGTFLFDGLGLIYKNVNFFSTSKYLAVAGIIAGLAAAIPGIIDYLKTIPPDSSAKKRGTSHGLVNTSSIICFSIALYLKIDAEQYIAALALEFVGVILLIFGGWMGGTLSYRNQIGVDIRYANAGKWKEANLTFDKEELEVANSDELRLNQMKLLKIGDLRIVLAKSEKGFVAFHDFCTHRGGSLAGGSMMCGTVQCPWHGSQFDVATGKVKAGPAKKDIQTYPVEEKGGKVFLKSLTPKEF